MVWRPAPATRWVAANCARCQQKQPPWRVRAPMAADERESLHAVRIVTQGARAITPCSPPPAPRYSIRPNRGRIVHQEIARATQCVIRIRRLSDRRTRVEIVVLIAGGAAAAERAAQAARRRPAAAIVLAAMRTSHARLLPTLSVLADATAAIDVAVRVAVPVAAPIGRTASRAIVFAARVARATLLAFIPIEHTAVAARAIRFQVAATAARVAAAFATADRPRRVPGDRHMARLPARTARIATRLTAIGFRTDRSAANGRQHR